MYVKKIYSQQTWLATRGRKSTLLATPFFYVSWKLYKQMGYALRVKNLENSSVGKGILSIDDGLPPAHRSKCPPGNWSVKICRSL